MLVSVVIVIMLYTKMRMVDIVKVEHISLKEIWICRDDVDENF